ncbi:MULTISPECIES: very short patch repair endonuclease [unclassified Mesorhizobium]|uniref:very short patch repair endonuclease n=1 Tax=unclassified Mesorhizobium TaxID=325217 RepID=UPI000FC9CADA|nr:MULTISPECIES: very short patch repair endonuclease [unclassified Mesorhizobium]TGP24873.1 DNA mismatch endonuclease Vsr [Mesorhizobium sp. M1D.F.Ca.ET.231.01.1.1]TGP36196.1 DNA mismatch endonuclease Vsr [Mesorhizobium sp. M1D.F.Ca.ET.234.01.1.1]TGS49698.1 DNA mismatch endonuclease Vsr [Mesorhizobium sp. M1D.F.Ca.ET.184.01.1.1]TGS64410.1 DNA mismatch endonuclease Vsr [Mesorhizobium sp. M1D.F.Ca.ET.183.01.1.1]
MADTLTLLERSQRMARINGADTKPELIVRGLLWHMGYRFRLHARDLPGKPDIVFRGRKRAIFVHGCFWHRHPDPACRLARLPKSRLDFWVPKLEANRRRDVENISQLRALGWRVLLVWECRMKDREQLGNTLYRFVEGIDEGD